jgi:type III secretory pathway component EscS
MKLLILLLAIPAIIVVILAGVLVGFLKALEDWKEWGRE